MMQLVNKERVQQEDIDWNFPLYLECMENIQKYKECSRKEERWRVKRINTELRASYACMKMPWEDDTLDSQYT